jgi:hypothetical protein
MKITVLAAALSLCAALPAAAQDFGTRWADRVVKDLYAERGPLDAQLTYDASAGLYVYSDSNVFLSETGEVDDVVLVPFVSGRIAYSEPNFEAAAELLVNYKSYSDLDDANDDEERFYGRLRYVGTEMNAGLVLVLRHESDPTSVLFLERVERTVADILPQVSFDLTPVFSIEISGLVQVVRHADDAVASGQDNENFSGKIALVYKLEGGIDALVEGGLGQINYTGDLGAGGVMLSPPDADVWFAHAGIRGELLPQMSVTALVGATGAQSDDYTNPVAEGPDDTTGSAAIIAQYTGVERFEFTASYHRAFTFAGGLDPYQITNRFLALAEYLVTEQLTIGARAQVEHTSSALDVQRDYISVGANATFKAHEYVLIDGGVTYRLGDTSGNVSASTEYDDVILYLGIALAY